MIYGKPLRKKMNQEQRERKMRWHCGGTFEEWFEKIEMPFEELVEAFAEIKDRRAADNKYGWEYRVTRAKILKAFDCFERFIEEVERAIEAKEG